MTGEIRIDDRVRDDSRIRCSRACGQQRGE